MDEPIFPGVYQHGSPLLLAVDCIIFGFDNQSLKLLLFKRRVAPFQNEWSLIGSFVKTDEDVEVAAQRILSESTGLQGVYMEELGCYGKADRDPGGRVVSIAHFALIQLHEHEKQVVEDYDAHWFDIREVPPLILDHNCMVQDAFFRLRNLARHQPIGFELLPDKFTIPQLQALYEGIYQQALDRRNFRKKILSLGVLDKLAEQDKKSSRKGAFLYRFNEEQYEKMIREGVDFVI